MTQREEEPRVGHGEVAQHFSVLSREVLAALVPRSGGIYCDATVGLGGHARQILEMSQPDGRLIAIDRDADALATARERLAPFGPRVQFFHAPFSAVPEVLRSAGIDGVDGCLADLGVSSPQLDRAERGFSFRADGPLDMRMDASGGKTAADIVRDLSEAELADLLFELGEEPASRRIARAICRARDEAPIVTTGALADLIGRVLPSHGGIKKNPATKTFQALRMSVNDELPQLGLFLDHAPSVLNPGGRLAVISFHSLEDRMVKNRLRALSKIPEAVAPGEGFPEDADKTPPVFRLLSRKAIFPSDEETKHNPRARSARLRVAEKLPTREAA
ncbi:MAG: 16S rRNA (cytosine(1402)-N(4))-methyltransferase RsmH [Deltaproteobacteria bacterium]|nr:16S rRNA (cytosine(1402)-N(4))-methyltransferase RsmH [Deltaproteobacteria bacterium]